MPGFTTGVCLKRESRFGASSGYRADNIRPYGYFIRAAGILSPSLLQWHEWISAPSVRAFPYGLNDRIPRLSRRGVNGLALLALLAY